jgi:tetratricopeptide (TPR) repeat protein
MHLLKSSTEASVHCTELRRVLKAIRRKDGTVQLTELMEIRVKKYLRKGGVAGIYEYREDYEQAKQHYDEAERHLNIAISDFEAGRESYAQEMEHLNRELDEIVIMAERRISELIEALRVAYKVLEKIN